MKQPRPGPRGVLRTLFLLEEGIGRRLYVLTGVSLMVLKYLVELVFVHQTTGELWTPLEYFNPFFSVRTQKLIEAPDWTVWAMALWSIPFIWVGVSMSVRRAVDAGRSPWLAMLFFLPGANYALMIYLAVATSSPASSWEPAPEGERAHRSGQKRSLATPTKRALLAAMTAAAGALAVLFVSVYLFRVYSWALFMGSPFFLGALGAFLFNRGELRSIRATLGVTMASLAIFAGLALLLALEGVVCLAMAFPIGLVLALPGAFLGRSIAEFTDTPTAHACMAVLVLPALAGVEGYRAESFHSEVISVIEIDAPPQVVWSHVVSFSELAPPSRFVFQIGVAYPVRARIEGEGIGAIRHCEFSTGAFVEPITCWEPGERLSFDVAEQPPPMTEWSFYARVDAPHLDDFLRCKRGEFRLIELPGGRTRLEGSTWYELEMGPSFYWKVYADALIHSIHERVLEHIKNEAEADRE